MRPRKKENVEKGKGVVPLILTDGDIDEITKKV